jgi:4'-phosphopantetheinyl transferase
MRPASRGTDRPLLEAVTGARRSVTLIAGWRRPPPCPEIATSEVHVWSFGACAPDARERTTREILALYTGLDPADIVIERMPSGKPVLSSSGGCPGLRFNASALSLLALRRDADIGVDLEAIRPMPDRVARRAMAGAELGAYDREPEARRAGYFFSLWAAKEAATKVRGQGLRQAFDAFEAGETARLPHDGGVETLWIRRIPSPRPGHAAAVASAAPFNEPRLWSLLEPPGS